MTSLSSLNSSFHELVSAKSGATALRNIEFSCLLVTSKPISMLMRAERGLDMELQRRVFAPQVRMIRTGFNDDGKIWRNDMSVEDCKENIREFLESPVFFEYETVRKMAHCRPFTCVLSEYGAESDLDFTNLTTHLLT